MPRSEDEVRYQPSVAGILRNARGEILICERLDTKGAWQFPQGSVAVGESWEAALRREISEEIGLRSSHFRLVDRRGPYRYLFGGGRRKKGFGGKEQHYFLLEAVDENPPIDLLSTHPEFRAYRWIRPDQFKLEWLSQAKREVYRQVLRDFFALNF
jgi:putative (di)nucleoside polyphosphate hydrolase